MAKRKK